MRRNKTGSRLEKLGKRAGRAETISDIGITTATFHTFCTAAIKLAANNEGLTRISAATATAEVCIAACAKLVERRASNQITALQTAADNWELLDAVFGPEDHQPSREE